MKESILKAITDLLRYNSGDALYITETESVLDRLASLYLEAGGSQDILTERWPEYFARGAQR